MRAEAFGVETSGFCYSNSTKKAWWEDEKPKTEICHLEKLRMTFDTGAAISAIPKTMCKGHKVEQDGRVGFDYTATNGMTVTDEGKMRVSGIMKDGKARGMEYRVAAVNKPLAAVSEIVASFNRAVLDPDEGSWIQHERPGDWVDLKVKKGVYVFDTWILPPKSNAATGAPDLNPVESDFPRWAAGRHLRRWRWL